MIALGGNACMTRTERIVMCSVDWQLDHPPFSFSTMVITIIGLHSKGFLKQCWKEKWACHKVYYEPLLPIQSNLLMVSRLLIVFNWRPGRVFIFTPPCWISGPFIVLRQLLILSHDKKPWDLAAGVESWCYSPTETVARAWIFIGLTPLFYCLSAFPLNLTTIVGLHKHSQYHVFIIFSSMLQRHITPCQT